jgi:hypothetical protein
MKNYFLSFFLISASVLSASKASVDQNDNNVSREELVGTIRFLTNQLKESQNQYMPVSLGDAVYKVIIGAMAIPMGIVVGFSEGTTTVAQGASLVVSGGVDIACWSCDTAWNAQLFGVKHVPMLLAVASYIAYKQYKKQTPVQTVVAEDNKEESDSLSA